MVLRRVHSLAPIQTSGLAAPKEEFSGGASRRGGSGRLSRRRSPYLKKLAGSSARLPAIPREPPTLSTLVSPLTNMSLRWSFRGDTTNAPTLSVCMSRASALPHPAPSLPPLLDKQRDPAKHRGWGIDARHMNRSMSGQSHVKAPVKLRFRESNTVSCGQLRHSDHPEGRPRLLLDCDTPRMVSLLTMYDKECIEPPSPLKVLEEKSIKILEDRGTSGAAELKDFRSRIRTLMREIVLESGGERDWGRALARAQSGSGKSMHIESKQFARLLSRLSLKGVRSDDEWIARKIFDALDRNRCGELEMEKVVCGLLPAFSVSQEVRLRWLWAVAYDPEGMGSVKAGCIFRMLYEFPEGCRLEEDLLVIVRSAVQKQETGSLVAVSVDEYVAAVQSGQLYEADILGLRKRSRRGSQIDLSRMLRARTRAISLLHRLGPIN